MYFTLFLNKDVDNDDDDDDDASSQGKEGRGGGAHPLHSPPRCGPEYRVPCKTRTEG